MEQGFKRVDFEAPIDLEGRLRAVPPHAYVKGLLVRRILNQLGRPAQEIEAVRPFDDFPVERHMELILEAAAHHHPAPVSPREALRRVGHGVFPSFIQSRVGRLIFHGPLSSPELILRSASLSYRMSLSEGSVEARITRGSAEIYLRGIWTFPDAYHVGVFQGAIEAGGGKVHTIEARSHSFCDVDLRLSW